MQIFLEGKLSGVDDCLLAPAMSADPDQVFTGRSHWISLLSEVLPRALLAELGLAKILLGSSGGGGFLLHADGITGAIDALDFNVTAPRGLDTSEYPLSANKVGNWFDWPSVEDDRNVSGY